MTDARPTVGSDEPSGTDVDALLAAALVEADQLRAQNRRQAEVLRRPLVRIGRRLDRPATRAVGVARRAADDAIERAGHLRLAIGARRARPQLGGRADALHRALTALPPIATTPGTRRLTLVVIDDLGGSGTTPVPDLDTDTDLTVEVSIAREGPGSPAGTAAARRAADAAAGDLIGFVPASAEALDPSWLARLAAAVGGPHVAAVPQLVHPRRAGPGATADDLLVRSLGVEIVDDPVRGPRPVTLDAGTAVRPGADSAAVAAATAGGFVVDREAYVAAGGLGLLEPLDAAVIDLCTRLRSAGGTITTVPAALLLDHRPVSSPAALVEPLDPRRAAWADVVDANGAALRRRAGGAAASALKVAITIAAPSARVAPGWGDWHLADGLARSLRALGVVVDLHALDRADALATRSCDVHLVLRGQQPVRRTPGQRHVLWIISHPESVEAAELDDADLVLVASERYAAHVAARTRTPVEVLLQATDHRRFRPVPPDPAHTHPVAIVATTRHVFRRSVADAIAIGLRPAIYGSGWHAFVDPELIVAEFIPNAELPTVYSSVDVLLNDHWDAMRGWGFVSNRLFDALACATPVVSDHLPEIEALFGDAVATYRDRDELRDRVDAILADPAGARQRAEAGRQRVLGAHTFDHRAATFLAALDRLGLVGAP